MADVLVATIGKNAREEFRVSVRTIRGRRCIDLRVHESRALGEREATPKGVVIQPDKLQAVIDALAEAGRLTAKEGDAQ